MPFDGIQAPQFRPDFFEEMIRRFEGGSRWVKCALRTGDKVCMLGMAFNLHYGEKMWDQYDLEPGAQEYRQAFAKALGFKDAQQLVDWNDHPDRHWQDIRRRLRRAVNGTVQAKESVDAV
jgi:hypothetical protein